MRRRRRIKINRLKYPLWFNIFFYSFTILIPLILIMVEGYSSEDVNFRWTFGVITGLLLLWTISYKFFISNKEKQILERKVKLEYDYETRRGNNRNIKYLWFNNEMVLTVIALIQVVLWGGLIGVLAFGIQFTALKLEYLTTVIALCYVIAFSVKFIFITISKGIDPSLEDGEANDEEGE